MKTILDPTFRYTASYNTDLKKTFAKIRRDHRQELGKAVPAPSAALVNISSIVSRTAGRR